MIQTERGCWGYARTRLAGMCICLLLVCLSGCASPYIGVDVNMKSQGICQSHTFPLDCSYDFGDLVVEYDVVALTGAGKYEVSGVATWATGISKSWTDYENAIFTLYLIHYGKVLEAITIYGGRGSLGDPITFRKTFETETDFKAVTIGYNMDVRG